MFWTRALMAVLGAQFLSAIADNAVLFAALALLKFDHYAAWTAPLLQEFFVAAYIVLAPFAGPFSDALPKGRVMLICNGVKGLGALGLVLGMNPFLAYGLVGLGAAGYSPAKYGILTELATPTQLVKANSWLESSTIAAILIGAVAGGRLSDWNVRGTLLLVVAGYAAAAAATLLIPVGTAVRQVSRLSLLPLSRGFVTACLRLWHVPDARFCVIGTSLFWGGVSTMRILLVAWVPVALGITTHRMPGYLTALVAVGIVAGAVLAARFIRVERAARAMPAGILLGVALCLLAVTHERGVAFLLMLVLGACGGFYVVPLNALLQKRGHETVGAGTAIALQNLADNAFMLVMTGLYTVAAHANVGVQVTAVLFGVGLSAAIAALWWHRSSPDRHSHLD